MAAIPHAPAKHWQLTSAEHEEKAKKFAANDHPTIHTAASSAAKAQAFIEMESIGVSQNKPDLCQVPLAANSAEPASGRLWDPQAGFVALNESEVMKALIAPTVKFTANETKGKNIDI